MPLSVWDGHRSEKMATKASGSGEGALGWDLHGERRGNARTSGGSGNHP